MAVTELLMLTAAVPNLDAVIGAWTAVSDYEVRERAAVPAALARLWGVEPGHHREAVVTAAPGSRSGFLRLVDTVSPPPAGPPYHHRGPMAIELFARNDAEVHARVIASDVFSALTPPVAYDLSSIGSGRAESFAFSGQGALFFLTTMKWVPPPRPLPVTSDFVGPVVNMPIVALDRDRSNRFYAEVLRMPVRFDGFVHDPVVNGVMGAPPEVAYHITVFFIGDGQMAEHHFHDPAHVVDGGSPSRLRTGAAGATYRVTELDDIVSRAHELGFEVLGIETLAAEPYRGARVAGLRGPNGELVELVE